MYNTSSGTAVYSAASSGLLCAFSFLYSSWGALAFVAFAPAMSLATRLSASQIYMVGLLTGVVAFGVANYWIYLFCFNLTASMMQSGFLFLIYIFYCAQGITLFLVGSSVLWKYLPLPVYCCTVPLLGASLFHAFPYLFDFSLAATQVGFSAILLPISYTGHWGLTSLILLSNTIVATLLISRNPIRLALCGTLVAALGFWFYLSADGKSSSTATLGGQTAYPIAIFQSNDPPSLVPTTPEGAYTAGYPKDVDQMYSLLGRGIALAVWPEGSPKGVIANPRVLASYQQHARRLEVNFLLQDTGRPSQSVRQNVNRSIYITQEGAVQYYQKVKRIPFGEYIPAFVGQMPFSSAISSVFSAINNDIQPGAAPVLFGGETLRILPFVCYDILHAKFVLGAVGEFSDIDLIVLQSNDAWFLSEYQSRMHNAFAILRAVESRRPLLHVNNRGPSYLINAFGKVIARTEYNIEAMYVVQVQSRGSGTQTTTFVTRHPHWFLNLASFVSLAAFLYILLKCLWARVLNLTKRQARPVLYSPH